MNAEAKGSNAVASGTESEEDEAVLRLAENEQEQPRTAMQKIANAIEDIVGELRKVLTDARKEGRTNVLMQVKSGDAMRFIALPLRSA